MWGDFNAHVGAKSDVLYVDEIVNNSSGIFGEGQEGYNVNSILNGLNVNIQRVNRDKLPIDDYGRRLIEMCQITSICLFNGRVGQDRAKGAPTTKHGTVVDYLIGSPMLFAALSDFQIAGFDLIFSDVPSLLIAKFHCGALNLSHVGETAEAVSTDNPKRSKIGRWQNDRAHCFIDNINMQLVEDLISRIDSSEELSVDDITVKINQILLNSAEDTFPVKMKKGRTSIRFRKDIPGYSIDSKQLKQEYYKAKNAYKRQKKSEKSKRYASEE